MKYIKESKFDDKKNNSDDKQLNIQSNIILDNLIKNRDYISGRIKEIFNYDDNSESVIRNPTTCNISIYTEKNNTDEKATTINVSTEDNLKYNRSWGRFLYGVEGKCELDYILIYSLSFHGAMKPNEYSTIDGVISGYEDSANILLDLTNKLKLLKEDLGAMKITKIHNIEAVNDYGRGHLMFELRKKNRIKIDPLDWIKKINKE